MEPRAPVSRLNAQEMRERAREYREMAATARTPVAYNGLLRLAARFDAMANANQKPNVTA
jgi:hypothetical protein